MRELKARLSEYLNRAAGGEVIRVTDRGRVKAVLGPVPGKLRLEEGIAEGWIAPASSGDPRPKAWRRFKTSRSVQEMLDEDRSD